MPIISALLFGISANIDTLMLGFSYGIKKQYISLLTNLFLSTITLLGTLFSIGIGLHLSTLITPAIARMTGSIFLILLGLYYCAKYFFKKRLAYPQQNFPHTLTATSISSAPTALTNTAAIPSAPTAPTNTADIPPSPTAPTNTADIPPSSADTSIPSTLSPAETIFLGLTLTLNNAGMGIGASLAGTHIFLTLGITFFTSALFLIAGNRLGTHFAAAFPWPDADVLSGLSIIILGLFFLVP